MNVRKEKPVIREKQHGNSKLRYADMNATRKNQVELAKNTIRQFFLVTLIDTGSREHLDKELIEKRMLQLYRCVQRMLQLYRCKAIIVATEKHLKERRHYHVGVWAYKASKKNFHKLIKKAYPEWTVNVSYRKGWGTLCSYVSKLDEDPFVWGEFSLSQIKEIAKSNETKKGAPNLKEEKENTPKVVLQKLRNIDQWLEVSKNDIPGQKVLPAQPKMR